MSRTPEAVRQLTKPQNNTSGWQGIKILIFYLKTQHYRNAYIFQLVFYVVGDQNIDLHNMMQLLTNVRIKGWSELLSARNDNRT